MHATSVSARHNYTRVESFRGFMTGTHCAYKRFLCQMEPEGDDVTPDVRAQRRAS
jgi:hypothetical protein